MNRPTVVVGVMVVWDRILLQLADSPILRIGLEKLKRNTHICLDNIKKAIN